MWTLSKATLGGTDTLRAVFHAFDRDATGYLDQREFQRIADKFGFGAAAHDIFVELDDDNSGAVNYNESECPAPREPMTLRRAPTHPTKQCREKNTHTRTNARMHACTHVHSLPL